VKKQLEKRQIVANILIVFIFVFIGNSVLVTIIPNLQKPGFLSRALNTTYQRSSSNTNKDPTKLANGDFEKNDFAQ